MDEILHQWRLVVYPIIFYRVLIHPKWCRISSINSIALSGGVRGFLGIWKTRWSNMLRSRRASKKMLSSKHPNSRYLICSRFALFQRQSIHQGV